MFSLRLTKGREISHRLIHLICSTSTGSLFQIKCVTQLGVNYLKLIPSQTQCCSFSVVILLICSATVRCLRINLETRPSLDYREPGMRTDTRETYCTVKQVIELWLHDIYNKKNPNKLNKSDINNPPISH